MWYFSYSRYNGEEGTCSAQTFDDACTQRRKMTDRPGNGMLPPKDTDVFYTSGIKCLTCNSFFKPDGMDGPDCRCV